MIARRAAALAVAAALVGTAPANAERPRYVRTLAACLYLLPAPLIYPLPSIPEPAGR